MKITLDKTLDKSIIERVFILILIITVISFINGVLDLRETIERTKQCDIAPPEYPSFWQIALTSISIVVIVFAVFWLIPQRKEGG